jgi:hypothetical protein
MLALATAWSSGVARADGDPASDVLVTQPLFLPHDAQLAAGQQAQLVGLLQEAARSGYPIRVALVASATDLGSVTELWRQPQRYALFLGQELSFVYRGPLLVVMPDGVGLYHVSSVAARGAQAHAAPGVNLATAAIAAVQALSAAAGHPHALPSASSTAGGSSGGGSAAPWIAFAAGVILVAAAWMASLRARPLTLRRRDAGSA